MNGVSCILNTLFPLPVIGEQDTLISLALSGGLCQPIAAYCWGRIIRLMMCLRKGDSAAAFTLRDVDGEEHSNDLYAGRWLLLMFHRHLN